MVSYLEVLPDRGMSTRTTCRVVKPKLLYMRLPNAVRPLRRRVSIILD
jgi:hypothetical protein